MVIVVTDCEYRTAASLVQALGRAGHTLVLCKGNDTAVTPPAFVSRYASSCHAIDAPTGSDAYLDALEAICRGCPEVPVLLPVGAKSIAAIAKNRARFDSFCKTLVPSESALDAANDKATVQRVAEEIGVPTPNTYAGAPDAFPVIVKPRCGEKLGLKAAKRYARADSAEEFERVYAAMRRYDEAPVVQEYVAGSGVGVCVVTDKDGNPAALLCHRRVREFPINGGPSTCCESFYDEKLVEHAVKLLRALGFVGVAMVEFRGDTQNGYKLLEINPRVWGSFPLTNAAESSFAAVWARAAAGESFAAPDTNYVRGRKMFFLLNDAAACLSLLKHGKIAAFFGGVRDLLSPRVREALYARDDPKPFWRYVKNTLGKRGKA